MLHPDVKKVNADAVRNVLIAMNARLEEQQRVIAEQDRRIATLSGRVDQLQAHLQMSIAGKYGNGPTVAVTDSVG